MSDQDQEQLQAQDDAAALRQWGTWIQAELARGQSPDVIAANMAGQGWTLEEATEMTAAVNQKLQNAARNAAFQRDALRRAAQAKHGRNILLGALWFIGGTAVTVGSYVAASSSREGGRYVLAWGAVIFGGFQFVAGLVGYLGTLKKE